MAFTKRVEEKHEVRAERTVYSAEIAGYDVSAAREGDDRAWEVRVTPIVGYDSVTLRLPMLSFYPRHVDDLNRLAEAAPALLAAIAANMREAGLIDLRGKHERDMDDWHETMSHLAAKVRAKEGGS